MVAKHEFALGLRMLLHQENICLVDTLQLSEWYQHLCCRHAGGQQSLSLQILIGTHPPLMKR